MVISFRSQATVKHPHVFYSGVLLGGVLCFFLQLITTSTENVEMIVSRSRNAKILDILGPDHLILHALGGIDGVDYTNSLEAFHHNHKKGGMFFEVDFRLTSDNELILLHDYNALQANLSSTRRIALKDFLHTKIKGTYQPATFNDLVSLMVKYPDIFIITDTKYTDKESIELQFNAMMRICQSQGATSVLERFIIQIYHEEMLPIIERIYPFSFVIFTLYMRKNAADLHEFRRICKWSKAHNISAITMHHTWYTKERAEILLKYQIPAYLFTVNDEQLAQHYILSGAQKIYTDFLLR